MLRADGFLPDGLPAPVFGGMRRALAPLEACCCCCRLEVRFLTFGASSPLVAFVGGGVGISGSTIGAGGGGVGAGGGGSGIFGIEGEPMHMVMSPI